LKIEAYGATDIGRVRKTNQDSFLIDDLHHLYLVADGIGGAKGGGEASALCVTMLSESVKGPSLEKPSELLKKTFYKINDFLFKASQNNQNLKGMGTTGTALLIQQGKAYCAHVGDSRAYLFQDGCVWQLTEDHTVAAQKKKKGMSSNENHVLTRSLGVEEELEIDLFYRKLHKNDIFLLCSDGLTNYIKNHEFSEFLNHSTPSEIPARLIEEANQRGGKDNTTVLLVRIIDTQ